MIKNTPAKTDNQHIEDMRGAFEHRAAWFALLINEARKKGLDISFARDAILSCGCFHAQTKFPKTDSLVEFGKTFVSDNVKKIFEMDVQQLDEEALKVNFHYCPLVTAWQKLGFSEEDISLFCDIAMDGDRGIASAYENFEFHLGDTIASGNDVCEVTFTKK